MNKKGQLGTVLYAIVFVILVGVILSVFSPVINDFRVEAINDEQASGSENALYLLFLYALMPLMWIFFLVISVVLLFVLVQLARGSPL